MRYLLLLIFLCTGVMAIEPTEVAVVYNAESALSKAAAERYCTVRRIPPDQMLPLFGVKRGNISRDDFEGSIMSSLLSQGRQRGLMWPAGPRNGIKLMKAMVLMPDIPLKVTELLNEQGKPVGTGQQRTEAAVDSELALLGSRFPLKGMGNNPHYKKKLPGRNERPKVLSVCRIDGPDPESVYRMINEPAAVEKTGLWGWVVVDNGGPYPAGDALMARVAELALAHHQPLFYETSRQTIAPAFPLMSQTIVYFGWYINPANGPFCVTAPRDFRFARGAIACHLHSYSATNLYDGKTWVSALLKRGACVTAGNVAEPYLGPCLNYGVFYEHLLNGAQVGEAALLATPSLSWQTIVLGDPLYRPFPKGRYPSGGNPFVAWQQMSRNSGNNTSALQSEVELKLARGLSDGLYAEIFALRCAEKKDFSRAVNYFALAADRYPAGRDKLRARLFMLTAQAAAGNQSAAQAGILKLRDSSASSPYLPAIQKTVDAIVPKPKPDKKAPAQKGVPQKK